MPLQCANFPYYEIATDAGGIIYICLACVYLLLEAYVIYETIKVFKTQKNVLRKYVLLICHICIHILYIRTMIFLLGGSLICFDELSYLLLGTYFYILKHIIIATMMFQVICILLESYTIPPRKKWLKPGIIIFGAVDFLLFTALFIIYYQNTAKKSAQYILFNVYAIFESVAFLGIFNYLMLQFKKFLIRMKKYMTGNEDYRNIILLTASINCAFIVRIIFTIIELFSIEYAAINDFVILLTINRFDT